MSLHSKRRFADINANQRARSLRLIRVTQPRDTVLEIRVRTLNSRIAKSWKYRIPLARTFWLPQATFPCTEWELYVPI